MGARMKRAGAAGLAVFVMAGGGVGLATSASASVLAVPPVMPTGIAAELGLGSVGTATAAAAEVGTAVSTVGASVAIGGLAIGYYGTSWAKDGVKYIYNRVKHPGVDGQTVTSDILSDGWQVTATFSGEASGPLSSVPKAYGSFKSAVLGGTWFTPQGDWNIDRKCQYSNGSTIDVGDDGAPYQISDSGQQFYLGFGCEALAMSQGGGVAGVLTGGWTGIAGVETSRAVINATATRVATAINTNVRCQAPGGSVSTISSSAAAGYENGLPDLTCPSGSHVVGVDVTTAPTPTAPNGEKLVDWSPGPGWTDPGYKYADCAAGSTNPCPVTYQDPETGAPVDSASVDPNTGTIEGTDTVARCSWGSHALTQAECFATPAVDPAPGPGTDTDPAPNPDPTGAPAPTPTPTPGGGGQPDPQEDGGECFPTGWGVFNPLEWVYRPVKCALSWAFVPDAATVTEVKDLGGELAGRAPGPELISVFRWFVPPTYLPSGCLVVAFDVPFGSGRFTAFDSCGDDPAVRWIREHRSLMAVFVWAGLLAPLAWWAWREYAPGSKGVA